MPDPAIEPVPIWIDKGIWMDTSRGDRPVPYKIYRPEVLEPRPYPLIIWSHGLGGLRDGAAFIARFLAAHGFIHVHIQHQGTDDSLWRGMPGHPWDNIRRATIPWIDVRNRYLDVPFALDQLKMMGKHHEVYAGRFDWQNVGMSGHSFGALTTQIMAGELAGREELEDLSDNRFKAGILYSPVPQFRHQHGAADVYAPIRLPLLHMTGTADESPVEGFGYEKRLEVYKYAGYPLQHLFTLNGGDHMVYNGSRGQLEANPLQDTHQNAIKQVAYAWWRAWLCADESAMNFLDGPAVQHWLGETGTYAVRGAVGT